ncbi:TRAP transporter small permease [Halopseudomonas bauzanensis]|uniref:TRAP transporter small permease protein n=1 Tax=Halopseudomonas bauzanensis TaxID=653930 RepID=A0A1I4J9H3_9GAMM|nr:TRAP transporter small permease [Halopseudomonas bauzanensis]SER64639.1 C4-dicarboxylate transporter, DctQ subunit/C4-dicarboxylate transporter, DctM subunit [Halopseudomonas bauzanensis]SFL62833.1 TRAP-type C4-dicarboxylate transport system, small permease component [Halopseudomonas bauzanensis]
MLKSIYAHFDEHVETYLATVALTVFASLVIFQVVMRYVFNNPSVWSEEIARYALVWFVYLSGSYAVKYQRHVRFNVIVDLIGKKVPLAQRIIRLFVLVLWLAFLIFMLKLAVDMVDRQFTTGQRAPASQIPMYLVYLGLPLGLLLMSFRVLQHTTRAIIDIVRQPFAPIPPSQTEVD